MNDDNHKTLQEFAMGEIIKELRAEQDALKTELEAARKQEPIIIRTMEGFEFLKTYEIGTKLYASPVPAQQAPGIVEAAHEVTRALTALRHTRDAFEIGGLIRSDINSICDVLDFTASKLFQIAKGGEND